ncbi:radical SAM protein [Klebsiella michiganensis]|uniref:SPL family radical SAM protein n=1 Tax=Klebsiella michiganensis TaxID=1134687 RepID=UPI0015F69F8F|nr:radical SAM protein [Klebsiella michiganensis]MBA8306098.1 radical SAM protein [Klebsiella michiganensis]
MNINYLEAKKILIQTKSQQWFGTDYTINIYRGCNLGCIYCDSRSECYHIDNFDTVSAKKNSIHLLAQALRSKQNGIIGFGSMSDPYNHLEKKLLLTRRALDLIAHYQFGAMLATKSSLILRDSKLLQQINQYASLLIGFSITCADDELSKRIERNASTTSQRFSAMAELSAKNIYTGTIMMPVIPFITDNVENIQCIIKKTYEAGGKFVFPWFCLSLRDKQREHFYSWLERLFPHLLSTYKEKYHENYLSYPPHYTGLCNIFEETCDQYNLIYDMKEIIQSYKKNCTQQLALF